MILVLYQSKDRLKRGMGLVLKKMVRLNTFVWKKRVGIENDAH